MRPRKRKPRRKASVKPKSKQPVRLREEKLFDRDPFDDWDETNEIEREQLAREDAENLADD
jgi:hypothetical protein